MKTLEKARLVRKLASTVLGRSVTTHVAIVKDLPCTARTILEGDFLCIEILADASFETLAHEFAHVIHYKKYGSIKGHSRAWEDIYYDLLELINESTSE